MKRKETKIEITIERVYNNIAILAFNIVFLIISILLLNNQNVINLRVYFGIGFFILFIIGYTYLFGDFLSHYTLKTWSWFRDKWPEYKFYYWLIILLVALVFLIILGYFKLDKKTFWTIIIGTGITSVIGAIGWILIRIIKKDTKIGSE